MKREKEEQTAIELAEQPAVQPEGEASEEEMNELQMAALDGMEQTAQTAGSVDEEFVAAMKAQADLLMQDVPDLDLGQEMEKFPLFATMLACGENLMDVYCYFHPEFAEKKMEQQVALRIQKRNMRPASIKSSPGETRVNVEQLSEKDMAEIDKRVRRGEKISF